jgi:hypothetical protein
MIVILHLRIGDRRPANQVLSLIDGLSVVVIRHRNRGLSEIIRKAFQIVSNFRIALKATPSAASPWSVQDVILACCVT